MHEAATILMRAAPGWSEIPTSDATFVFQFADATMTILSDGSWSCVAPHTRLTRGLATGKVGQLEKFLQDWGAANPL
jgi:hypothetical protein